jgi:ribosomal protein S18 acetylase RimI-like enzyme
MNWTLEQVGPDEVGELHEVVRICGEQMLQRFGFGPWVPPLPLEQMRDYARKSRVFSVRESSRLIATFSLDGAGFGSSYPQDLLYNPQHRALYVGKLAVLPEYQSCGVGSWCLMQVERLAQAEGYEAIRLDMIAEHTALVSFYTRSGFQFRGTFPASVSGTSVNLSLFEKPI